MDINAFRHELLRELLHQLDNPRNLAKYGVMMGRVNAMVTRAEEDEEEERGWRGMRMGRGRVRGGGGEGGGCYVHLLRRPDAAPRAEELAEGAEELARVNPRHLTAGTCYGIVCKGLAWLTGVCIISVLYSTNCFVSDWS